MKTAELVTKRPPAMRKHQSLWEEAEQIRLDIIKRSGHIKARKLLKVLMEPVAEPVVADEVPLKANVPERVKVVDKRTAKLIGYLSREEAVKTVETDGAFYLFDVTDGGETMVAYDADYRTPTEDIFCDTLDEFAVLMMKHRGDVSYMDNVDNPIKRLVGFGYEERGKFVNVYCAMGTVKDSLFGLALPKAQEMQAFIKRRSEETKKSPNSRGMTVKIKASKKSKAK